MKVCVVGASGKLGKYMVQHALERGYEVVGVCRERSVGKLDAFKGRITIVPGATNDRAVIERAVAGCDGVLTVLVPWGVQQYATGTAQAVLDHAPRGARLVFSCGWHITRDGKDRYSRSFKWAVAAFGRLARLVRFADLADQVDACRRVFASDRRWTVVRGSDLEEGASEGLPVWSRHVGDPILGSNRTRRIDFALFMVAALTNDALMQEAPAIVGCRTPSALAHRGLSGVSLRAAGEGDVAAVMACVDAAYRHYVERIGGPPGPMSDDYAEVIRRRRVTVAESAGGVVGVLVLGVTEEGFLLENVALDPSRRGTGLGRALLRLAEAEARSEGFDSIYLYTHEKMTENRAMYAKIGYAEYDRRFEKGLARVYMRKSLR